MDFTLKPEWEDLRTQVRNFIGDEVLYLEEDRAHYDEHENIALPVLKEKRAAAKAAGLWAPQASKDRGGLGLPVSAWAAFYEEANRSIFGPVIMNCAAPDDGNINLLSKIGTDAQKDWFLQPVIDGEVRSSFAMTEPAPGSGSDPSMMRTTAENKGDKWVINGHKWYITGAEEAAHFILVARTSNDRRKGLTAFLFHKDQPGWHIEIGRAHV